MLKVTVRVRVGHGESLSWCLRCGGRGRSTGVLAEETFKDGSWAGAWGGNGTNKTSFGVALMMALGGVSLSGGVERIQFVGQPREVPMRGARASSR